MKKLALAVATLCLAATPVLACPHSDHAEETAAPKTAEKAKEAPKAAETPKQDAAPAKETAKTAKTVKPAPKAPAKTDKVSSR